MTTTHDTQADLSTTLSPNKARQAYFVANRHIGSMKSRAHSLDHGGREFTAQAVAITEDLLRSPTSPLHIVSVVSGLVTLPGPARGGPLLRVPPPD